MATTTDTRVVATRLPRQLLARLEHRLRDHERKLGRLGIATKVTRSDVIRACIAESMDREPDERPAKQAARSRP